jgi:uncharacterized membrane protein
MFMKKIGFKTPGAVGVLATLLFFLLQQWSCKREPVYFGTLDPNPVDTTQNGGGNLQPCSPDSVYFEQQLLPVLQSNCAQSGCHDAASAEEGVVLESYTTVRATGGINLSNPSKSKIYKVLFETDPDELMPPPPAIPLTAAQKALLLTWIQQGAQNLHCDGGCDTTNVRFSTVIQPLINTRCTGCHSTASPQGNISLSTYADIKAQADNQKLWGSVNHLAGFKPMPYPAGNSKMPDCQITQIRIWLDAGAPNN